MKKVAIMQPYIFPYIGYFQLIQAVDTFVFYDDVNFIKHGWINRNKILLGGSSYLFTVPVEKISSFRKINQTEINKKQYPIWISKFLKTLKMNYRRAPYFGEVYPIIESVMTENNQRISILAKQSIIKILEFLGLKKKIILSSDIYDNNHLYGHERVLDICKKEGATNYINMPGGKALYDYKDFKEFEIKLMFIQPRFIKYTQFKNNFIPGLSIIDVLMFNSPEEVNIMLKNYELS